MNKQELREELAAKIHEQWTGWMEDLFSRCTPHLFSKSGLHIPAKNVDHWQNLMITQYSELAEKSKDSDRKEADWMIEIFEKHYLDIEEKRRLKLRELLREWV